MKKTALYAQHQALGARMVEFAGWAMPVQYPTGTIKEHKAVRECAGLFDVSHMGEFIFQGPDAGKCLQQMTANDVSTLHDGEAQYSLILNERGGIVDDVIVYRRTADDYLMVVNAGNLDTDWHWVMAHQTGEVTVKNVSHAWALLAIQGPLAETILQSVTQAPLGSIKRFATAHGTVSGIDVTFARTGYTGEAGFELFVPAEHAPTVWTTMLEAGTPHGMLPCGLGARDTLRLEVAYPLHGHDINDDTTPLETRLGWVTKLGKEAFVGKEALQNQQHTGCQRQLVGFTMIDPGIPREGYALIFDHKPVGYVTSGTMSPMLKVGIGLGFLPRDMAAIGTKFAVDIRGHERLAEVVKLPFYASPTA